MKFKFDQIEIDLKIKKAAAGPKSYKPVQKPEMRMHSVKSCAAR